MNNKYHLLFFILILLSVFTIFDFKKIEEEVLEKPFVSEEVPKPTTVSILSFGDVMFDRGVRNIMENRSRDPFEYIKTDLDILKKFDVVSVNLEGPIVEMDRSLCQKKIYNFQFGSSTPEILKTVGINMVNIANNHNYDCLKIGFESTKSYLQKSGMDYMGDTDLEKSFVIKIISGKKVAFVGMDETVQIVPIVSFYPLIKRLDLENDYVVVNIHWGTEYALIESEAQIKIAQNLVDNGADVIFGHHPHVIQPVRVYKGKAIFYSLGNFVFDQNFGDTTTGLGAGVEFDGDKSKFTVFPFNIKTFAPDFMEGNEKDEFCQKYLTSFSHNGCKFEL